MAPSPTPWPTTVLPTATELRHITSSTVGTDSAAAAGVVEEEDEFEMTKWVMICVAFILLGLSLATCQYIWDTYYSKEKQHKRKEDTAEKEKKKEEKAIAAIKKEPIPVEQFLQRLRQKKLDKYLNFEVRAIVRNQEEYSCMKATQIENIPKNVCQDVLPCNDNILESLEEFEIRLDSTEDELDF